ncbi:MAG: hypothetical protein WAU00_20265 [Caldilinea sp.]
MSERKWRPLFLSYLLRQRALVISIGALIGLATLLFVSTLLLTSPPVLAQDGNQLFLPIISGGGAAPTPGPTPGAPPVANDEYVVLGWNDLGMHCYNRDFQNLAVLPPYNNLWAQVIKRGDPPQIITDTLNVSYSFPDNTYSMGKSNFWEFDQQLFGVDLPDNVGLTGKGLAGEMDAGGNHFVAEGIPLTEFSDSNPNQPEPYQLADVVVTDASGKKVASSTVVAPVSTEMHCDNCHYDGGVEGIRTGSVETNILRLHDKENADDYPSGHTGNLMGRRPVLCAECHASNALGAPGVAGLPNLSRAIHKKHAGKVQNTTEGCYNCHPGPTTKCLRDVMSAEFNMGCTDCHGDMEKVAKNPSPWLNEPRCDACHKEPQYAQNNPLFRLSTGHGGVYCEGCHDSTHAIAPSSQGRDAIKFIELQGHGGPIDACTVCHVTAPAGGSPHDAP